MFSTENRNQSFKSVSALNRYVGIVACSTRIEETLEEVFIWSL